MSSQIDTSVRCSSYKVIRKRLQQLPHDLSSRTGIVDLYPYPVVFTTDPQRDAHVSVMLQDQASDEAIADMFYAHTFEEVQSSGFIATSQKKVQLFFAVSYMGFWCDAQWRYDPRSHAYALFLNQARGRFVVYDSNADRNWKTAADAWDRPLVRHMSTECGPVQVSFVGHGDNPSNQDCLPLTLRWIEAIGQLAANID